MDDLDPLIGLVAGHLAPVPETKEEAGLFLLVIVAFFIVSAVAVPWMLIGYR